MPDTEITVVQDEDIVLLVDDKTTHKTSIL